MFRSLLAALIAALLTSLTLSNPIPENTSPSLNQLSQRAADATLDYQIIMISAGSQVAVKVPTDGWIHNSDSSDVQCLSVSQNQYIPCSQQSVYNIATVKPGVVCTFGGYNGWLATQAYQQPVMFLSVGAPQPMEWFACSTN